MVVKIDPIEIDGCWDKGYALDIHTLKSIPIGEDPYGHMQFDTTYTEIGKLLNMFKYKNQYDSVYSIVDTAYAFLRDNPEMTDINFILPVPPSNKNRAYQPTFEIAELLAKQLNTFSSCDVLEKISDSEYKNLSSEEKREIHGMIRQNYFAQYSHNVLLIDDIYDTGSTLRQCTEVLRMDPKINKIYVLTITKKRTR